MTATVSKRKIKKSEICKRCNDLWKNHTCYWSKCVGCPEGHASMHKTLIESPQWEKWRKHAWEGENMLYDFPECEELGIISSGHLQDFLKFIKGGVKFLGKIK